MEETQMKKLVCLLLAVLLVLGACALCSQGSDDCI